MYKLNTIIFVQILCSLYSEVELFDYGVSIKGTTKLFASKFQTCSKNREAPINILSNQTQFVKSITPLEYHINIYGTATVTNNGYGVVINPDKKGTGFSLSGGFLGKARYLLHGIELLWTKDGKGRSASAIDGLGAPVELVIIYVNKKCGPIEKARNFFNCIFVSLVGILVVDKGQPNLGFQSFINNVLKKITTPNSTMSSNYLEAIVWALPNKKAKDYYIYSASYRDSYGTLYKCAAMMHLPIDPTRNITTKQFEESFSTIQANPAQKPLEPNNGLKAKKYKKISASLDNYEFIPGKIFDEL